ncbi:MAG: hypothetical protein AAF433_19110 [Bacteroidota bacterium]
MNNEHSSPKPQWLAKLEEESWQAELIISGVAILGALQLPALIESFQYYLLDTLYRSEFMYWSFVSTLASIGVNLLIITFILHFSIRTLWIGMVGINSVYPQGFTRNKRFSEDYQDKLVEEFGDINGYIQRLDRLGSSIFGMGFSVSLVCWGYIFLMLCVGVLAHLLHAYLPPDFLFYTGITLYVLMILVAVISATLSSKKYRETAFAKRWHFPLSTSVSKIFFNIGYRPVMIITNLATSAVADKKGGPMYGFIVGMLAAFIGGFLSAQSNLITEWDDGRYHRSPSDTTLVAESAYLTGAINSYYFQPVIDKKELQPEEVLTIFVPLPQREKEMMMDSCSIAPLPEGLEKSERRQAKRERTLQCADSYISIALNGEVLNNYRWRRHYQSGRREQFGVQTVLYDLPGLRLGENLLRVTTNFFNEDGQPRDAFIYFYYSGATNPADSL